MTLSIIIRHGCLICLVCLWCAAWAVEPTSSVLLQNLGHTLELTPTGTPPGLPAGRSVRYFKTPDGAPIAMANRLLVVLRGQPSLRSMLGRTPIRSQAILAQMGDDRIVLLETKDVDAMLALHKQLQRQPGVLATQPDISQNIVPQDAGVMAPQPYDLDQALGLSDAWRISQGRGVRVAVIDSGIDLRHRDLRGVSLLASYDIEQHTTSILPNDASERHGTQVAGVIFAGHSEAGLAGIAPQAGLIGIRLRTGWTSSLVLALQAAAQEQADVINCSWSFPLMLEPVARIVDYLATQGRNGRGTLIVAAAGNQSQPLGLTPPFAAYPALLAVAAHDQQGKWLGGAAGNWVFIAAPGRVMTSSNRQPDAREIFSGTSAAAPVVTGVIALMLAADPALKRAEVLSILHATVDQPDPAEIRDGRWPLPGFGRIHAGRALAALMARTKTKQGEK